jgi:hypothetical protein
MLYNGTVKNHTDSEMNQILNKHHFTKGGLPLDSIYIGRGGIWANPYSHKPSKFQVIAVGTRAEAIEMYRRHLWDQIWTDHDQPIART